MVAGIISECALVIAAVVIGRLAGVHAFERFRFDALAVAYGVAATLPPLLLLRWCLRTAWAPMRRLVALVEDRLGPELAGASTPAIVVLSLLAGLGEEALFRGVMQAGIAERFPAWLGVAGAGLLFGVMHWLTLSYAVLAGLVGMYLGAVFLLSGNLLVPIVAHGLYDIVALSILARRHAGSNAVPAPG